MKSEAAPIPFPIEEASPLAQWLATDERIFQYIPVIRTIEGPYREAKGEDDLIESHEAVFTITIETSDGQLVETEWSTTKSEKGHPDEDITLYFSVPVPVALKSHIEDLVTDFDVWSKQQGISLSPTNLGEDQEPWGAFYDDENQSTEIEFQTEYYGTPIPIESFFDYLSQAVASIQTIAPASQTYMDWYQREIIPTINQQKVEQLQERLNQTSWLSQLINQQPEAKILEHAWELKGVLEQPKTESIYAGWKTPIGEALLRLNASYREEITQAPYSIDIGFTIADPAFLKTASEFTDIELEKLMNEAMYMLNHRDGRKAFTKFPELPDEHIYWKISHKKLLYPWSGEELVFSDELFTYDDEPLTVSRVERIIQELITQTEAWYLFLDIIKNQTALAKKIVTEDD